MTFKIQRTTEVNKGILVQEISHNQQLWLIHYQKENHLAKLYYQFGQFHLQQDNLVIVVAGENTILLLVSEKEKTPRNKLMKMFTKIVDDLQPIWPLLIAEYPLFLPFIILLISLSAWFKSKGDDSDEER